MGRVARQRGRGQAAAAAGGSTTGPAAQSTGTSSSSSSSSSRSLARARLISAAAAAAAVVVALAVWGWGGQAPWPPRGPDTTGAPPTASRSAPRPPLEPPRPRFHAVDAASRVYYSDRFMQGHEIDHVLQLVDRTGGWKASPTGGKAFQVPLDPGGLFRRTTIHDPIIAILEERIADATGIPVHPHEDQLSLAKIESRGRSPRDGNFPPFGLHHETDERPYRARTVLVYLTDTPEGGRTVFPLAGTPPTEGPVAALHRDFEEALQSQWSDEAPAFRRHVWFDPSADHPFMDLLEETCAGRHGLGFRPKRGSAIMFDSLAPDGRPNRVTWHAGCNVLNGTKIIMQKFKELPMEQRSYREPPVVPYSPYRAA